MHTQTSVIIRDIPASMLNDKSQILLVEVHSNAQLHQGGDWCFDLM